MYDEQLDCREPDPSGVTDLFTSESLERIVAYLEVQIEELDRRERLLNGELACLDSERSTLRMQVRQFEEQVEEQDAHLKQRELAAAETRSAADLLGRRLEHERERLARERGQVESVREGLRQEQSSWREQFEQEMADRRREIEQQDRQVSRRMVDLEKRARFHEAHLEKLRRDLDRQKHELDVAVQRQRLEREQAEDQIRRRRAQLETYREQAERRDRSHERHSAPPRANTIESDAA